MFDSIVAEAYGKSENPFSDYNFGRSCMMITQVILCRILDSVHIRLAVFQGIKSLILRIYNFEQLVK